MWRQPPGLAPSGGHQHSLYGAGHLRVETGITLASTVLRGTYFGRDLAGNPIRLLLCRVFVEAGIGIHIIFRIDRNLSLEPPVDSLSEPVHLVITHWFILHYRSGLWNLQAVCLIPLVWVDHFRVN